MSSDEQKKKVAYLSAYKWIMADIDIKEERLARLDERITSLRSLRITDMPKGGQAIGIDDIIVQKVDLFNEINERLKEANCEREKIETAIHKMERYQDRVVLELKYIQGMRYEEMTDVVGYSLRHVKRMHWAAIDRFKIPDDSEN